MRVIANRNDDVNLLRIINTPRRGIGKAGIQTAAELAKKNHSALYDSLCRINHAKQSGQQALFPLGLEQKEEKNARSGIEEFLELIQSSADDFFGAGALSEKVRKFVDRIDYWSYLVSEHGKDEKKARWKFANVEYLIKMIEDWEKDPDLMDRGLYAYLNRISLLTRTDGGDEPSSRLSGKANLMTIHAAKGLEFPVVFIAGAEDGIIPHERSLEETDDVGAVSSFGAASSNGAVEEERRLFYVAITRARDKLIITSCQNRSRGQSVAEKSPSPFLAEIPPLLIESRDEEEDAQDDADLFFARMKERFGSN
jgi:DNA helicase-2/ATP-dependent DNA helicase PcrA